VSIIERTKGIVGYHPCPICGTPFSPSNPNNGRRAIRPGMHESTCPNCAEEAGKQTKALYDQFHAENVLHIHETPFPLEPEQLAAFKRGDPIPPPRRPQSWMQASTCSYRYERWDTVNVL
jgi:hypothetical protein